MAPKKHKGNAILKIKMKQFGGVVLGLMLTLQLFLLMPSSIANAAACEESVQYGSVRLYLPEVNVDKQYALWLRVQSSDSSIKLLVEQNLDECYQFAGTTPKKNQWFWQQYKVNNKPQLIKFLLASGNSLRIIGTQAGVRVDKVLLTDPSCVPEVLGDNCFSALQAVGINENELTMLPSPSDEPVRGKVSLSTTPRIFQTSLKQVSYVVDGRTLQASNKPDPFDTTLAENGKHTVHIETLLQNGTLIREATVVDIENPENILTPALRWVRLNSRSLILTAMVVTSIIILLLLIGGVKSWLLKRRQLHFHGF